MFFTAAKRRSAVKALRKRDARNVQALRLAHVSAGRGAGAYVETSRATALHGTPGETGYGFHTRTFNYNKFKNN